jgi:hypothetical protein
MCKGDNVKKKTVNLTVSQDLADAFDGVCGRYGHGKQKGMVLSAAILMFLEASAANQTAFVKRVAVAEVDGRLSLTQPAGAASSWPPQPAAAQQLGSDQPRPRLAARRARAASRQGRRGLPPLPG